MHIIQAHLIGGLIGVAIRMAFFVFLMLILLIPGIFRQTTSERTLSFHPETLGAKAHVRNVRFMVGMENVTQQFQDGIPNPATIVSA